MVPSVSYPRDLAHTEINSRKKSKDKDLYIYNHDFNSSTNIDNSKLEELKVKFKSKITKSTISLAGAYPFLWDGLIYLCNYHQDDIDNIDNDNYFLSIRLTYKAFLNICLGGKKHLRKRFATELKKLHNDNEYKLIPYDLTSLIKTRPINISYKTTDPDCLLDFEITRIENLGVCPISEIQVDFIKSPFLCLFKYKSEKFFPSPTAFYANLIDCIEEFRLLPEFENFPNYQPSGIRKVFLYINLHDNSIHNKLNLDAIDLFLNCAEQYIQEKENSFYLKNWHDGYRFVQYSLLVFQKMAEKGLMDKCKFKPSGLWYNKNTGKFELSLIRNKEEFTKKIKFIFDKE